MSGMACKTGYRASRVQAAATVSLPLALLSLSLALIARAQQLLPPQSFTFKTSLVFSAQVGTGGHGKLC